MSFPSATNGTPDGLGDYVAELRRFSETHRLPTGKPEDLQGLWDHLAHDREFTVEFESMVRSIVYRENFRTTPDTLLNLIGLAWGGAKLASPGSPLEPPIGNLASFLRDAMKFPQLGSADSAELPHTNSSSVEVSNTDRSGAAYPWAEAAPQFEKVLATEPRVPSAPAPPRAIPWWAESGTDAAFSEPAPSPVFLQQTELVAARSTDPLTDDPWQNNSAFHQELVRIVEDRRKAHPSAS